jgi:RNA recognition motif-containing protein
MNIFVTKLSPNTSQEDLQDLFAQYGAVSSAKVIIDRETGNSKGYGFVEMDDDSEGQAAIDAINDSEIDGRRVVVKVARPREDDGGGRRSFGGNRGGFDRERSSGGFDRDRRGGGGGGGDRGGYNRDRGFNRGGYD